MKIDIDHILKLARIEIPQREKKKLKEEFSSILSFVKKLEEIDVKDARPMNYTVDLENIMRGDDYPPAVLQIHHPPEKEIPAVLLKSTTYPKKEISRKLLDLVPNTKDRYIKVKSVF